MQEAAKLANTETRKTSDGFWRGLVIATIYAFTVTSQIE